MTPAAIIPTAMGWAIAGGGRAANVAAGTRYAGTTSQLCGLFPFAVTSGATLTGVPLGRSVVSVARCRSARKASSSGPGSDGSMAIDAGYGAPSGLVWAT